MTDYDERYRRLAIESEGWGRDFMRAVRTLYGQAVALLMHGIDSLRRTQVRLVVRLAPPDVADAVALKDRLFPTPAADVAEQQLRDACATYLAKEASTQLERDEWLTLAQVLRTLREDYKQDPLRQMVNAALSRRAPVVVAPPPAVEPAAMPMGLMGAQGFVGGAIGGLTTQMFFYASMGLAAIALFLGGWVWLAETRIDRLKLESRQARETQKELLADNVQLREALRDTDARVGEANRAAMENAKRAADVSKQEVARRARELANRKRLEEKNAERAKVSNPELSDPDAWLRELSAQPFLSASPVAPADAPRGSVTRRTNELPGSAGGDAPPGQ